MPILGPIVYNDCAVVDHALDVFVSFHKCCGIGRLVFCRAVPGATGVAAITGFAPKFVMVTVQSAHQSLIESLMIMLCVNFVIDSFERP